jgi:ELWxxDGT repeat protein
LPPKTKRSSTPADGGFGAELWKSDGTAAGTVLVREILPGPGSSTPWRLTAAGNMLLFVAWDGAHWGLWKSDGTPQGTTLVLQGAFPASQHEAAGQSVYFAGFTYGSGTELWRSDGTTAGTGMVADLWPGALSCSPTNLMAVGTKLYFQAETPDAGRELVVTDGTAAGTHVVKDVVPGRGGSFPIPLAHDDTYLYFTAWTPESGRELWKTDGMEAGTVQLTETAPWVLGGIPWAYRASNGLVFSGFDELLGFEPWMLPLPESGDARPLSAAR